MNKIQEACAIETIKQQCLALNSSGFETVSTIFYVAFEAQCKVIIRKNLRAWHFADPDLNVIIAQLCMLQKITIKKSNPMKDLIKKLRNKKYVKIQRRR